MRLDEAGGDPDVLLDKASLDQRWRAGVGDGADLTMAGNVKSVVLHHGARAQHFASEHLA